MIRAGLLALLLVGCTPQTPQQVAGQVGDAVKDTAADVGDVVSDAAGDAGVSMIQATAPVTLAIADAVQPTIAGEPLPPLPVDPAIDLITRWEVSGQANYNKKLTGVICPGGASGPTAGIGYDFGHQTQTEIRRVWGWHPEVERLATASGKVGAAKCVAWRNDNRDIRVTWDEARRVFAGDSLPKYRRLAERALPGLKNQSPGHNSGLTSIGYRRGWSMEGERNREKRVIRADCVPASNSECSAAQVVAMCRIWAGTPNGKGQCNRSNDEARVIRS